jgi:hypothetical protein
MATTAEQRGHFRGRFRIQSGWKVTASFDRKANGQWRIFSVGGVDVPTAFLPFHLSLLPGLTFETLEDAKRAVKSA